MKQAYAIKARNATPVPKILDESGAVDCPVLLVGSGHRALAASDRCLGQTWFTNGPTRPSTPRLAHQAVRVRIHELDDVVSIHSEMTGKLVTHCVDAIEPLDDGSWEISMKGDANDEPDPRPMGPETRCSRLSCKFPKAAG